MANRSRRRGFRKCCSCLLSLPFAADVRSHGSKGTAVLSCSRRAGCCRDCGPCDERSTRASSSA